MWPETALMSGAIAHCFPLLQMEGCENKVVFRLIISPRLDSSGALPCTAGQGTAVLVFAGGENVYGVSGSLPTD